MNGKIKCRSGRIHDSGQGLKKKKKKNEEEEEQNQQKREHA